MKNPKKNNFFSWQSDIKRDIPSAIVVFLVALPLCLGIASASDAPPLSGIIAGIVGGIVVTIFSGSSLGVSGPAAGLITIVSGAIAYFSEFDGEVNGFQMFLVAVILSGILQVLLGIIKLGKLVAFFPSAVINGMLAGIGLIIILKQIPHAFGYDSDFEGDTAFNQPDGENTFSELFSFIKYISDGPSIIFGIGILITLIWSLKWMKKQSFTKIISAPLVIVVSGALMVLGFQGTEYALIDAHLVDLPKISGVGDVFTTFPDFGALSYSKVYITAITLALVASLESLLCMEAADKIDPEMRKSPPNKELIAQGMGNIVSGFLGGLPVTQVIVRSSANVQNGAKSKLSAFVHGWLLLISILLIPDVLNYVPLSALAAILIFVGYKLSKPTLYLDFWQRGWQQFIPFVVTILGILLTDLLVGIGLGFLVSLIITMIRNEVKKPKHILEMINSAKLSDGKDDEGNKTSIITLSKRISFLSKAKIRSLADNAQHERVIFDLMQVEHIDTDGQEILGELESQLEQAGKKVKKHGSALIK